jgi:hypothetical protein
MANKAHSITHWAIIIGINYYPKDRCLQGSVRDAETVKHYLERGIGPVDTVILAASTPLDPSSGIPIEERELWPTYENVVSSIKRVLISAKPGDKSMFTTLDTARRHLVLPSPDRATAESWLCFSLRVMDQGAAILEVVIWRGLCLRWSKRDSLSHLSLIAVFLVVWCVRVVGKVSTYDLLTMTMMWTP